MMTSIPLSSAPASRAGVLVGRLGLLVLLALAIPTRVLNLDAFAGKFDEGIRGAQLMLMAAGFRPFRDIFASQGPLSLDLFFPTYMLFGQTLGAARLAPAICSVVGIVVAAWTARQAFGPATVGGLVAAGLSGLLLTISPIFLKNSRLALVEVPSLVPAIAAVGLAFAYARSGDRRWLAGAGILMAVSLSIKPMAAPALVPIALIILLRGPGRVGEWLGGGLLFGLVLMAVVGIIVLAVGPSGVYDQMVRFRVASRQVEGWSLKENWAAISGEIADEQLVIPAATIVAGLVLLACRWRIGLPLVGWAAASLGLLLVYSPLQFKHAVILLPPMALLIGAAAGEGWRRWQARHAGVVRGSSSGIPTSVGSLDVDGGDWLAPRLGADRLAWVIAALGLVLGAWYLASLPKIVDLDRRLVSGMPESRPESFDDEIRLLPALVGPSDFVIVDEPSVAFGSRRLVPPSLVDTSMVRIRSRSLDASDVIAAAQQYDVKALFLFSDGLRTLKPFSDWVDDQFVAIKINERRNGKDRALYLRRDVAEGAQGTAARTLLEQSLSQSGALSQGDGGTFAGQMRLLGAGAEPGELRPGGSLTLTLGWQAIGPISADYSIVTALTDQNGQVVEQNQRGLGGGGEGTAAWEPGRWAFRTSTLDLKRSAQPGPYTLTVGLYDSKARKLVPPDGRAGAGSGNAGTDMLTLGTIQVRP
jgi:hypothetical protein